MNQKEKKVSFSPETINVSHESKTSASSRQSTPFNRQTIRRSFAGPVPLRFNEEDEPVVDIAEVDVASNVLQTAEQRRAADDKLVDKVKNGNLFLQLKMLDEVLSSLVSKIGLESLTKELQNFLNLNELTKRIQKQAKLIEPLQNEVWLREADKVAEFTDTEVERRVGIDEKLDVLVEDAPARSKQLQSVELSRKAETVEESKKNEKASRFDHDKLYTWVKEAPAEGVLLSRLVDLYKILKALTKFCKDIIKIIKVLDKYQPGTDDYYEKADVCINILNCLKPRLPEYLIDRYESSKLFHKFSTGSYVKYFSNFFKKDKSTKEPHLRRNIVNHLPELASWLQLYIPMLVEFGNAVSYLNITSWYEDWENRSRDILREPKRKFSEFNFSEPSCKSDEFALKLIDIVDVFIKDVSLELSEMIENLTEKLDVRSEKLL